MISRLKNYLQDIILYTKLVFTGFRDKHRAVSETLQMKSLTNQMLLPPTILLNNLKELHHIIQSREKRLPFKIENEALNKFYDIARIQNFIFKNKLMIVYILPLIDIQSGQKCHCHCENIKITIHITIAIAVFALVCIIILMVLQCCNDRPWIRESGTQKVEIHNAAHI